MKKIILAAMSAGILSGCSSAPPLATPKGEFVEMNTDITTLLPQVKPVYTGSKPTKVSEVSLVKQGSQTVKKVNSVSDINVGKKSGLLVTNKPKDKPVELKGYTIPVLTGSKNAELKKPALGEVSKTTIPSTPVSTVQPKKIGKNPFHSDAIIRNVQNTALKPVIMQAPIKIAPVALPLRNWVIPKGSTLKTVFNEWAAKEKCSPTKSWSVAWNTETDYSIDNPLTFTGSFEEVTLKLFSLYINANTPLYADGYKSQCLIVISENVK